jgi:hypothetical protein
MNRARNSLEMNETVEIGSRAQSAIKVRGNLSLGQRLQEESLDGLFVIGGRFRCRVVQQVLILPLGQQVGATAPIMDHAGQFAVEMRFQVAERIGYHRHRENISGYGSTMQCPVAPLTQASPLLINPAAQVNS